MGRLVVDIGSRSGWVVVVVHDESPGLELLGDEVYEGVVRSLLASHALGRRTSVLKSGLPRVRLQWRLV